MQFNRKNIVLLSLLTLVGFSALGLAIVHWFVEGGIAQLLKTDLLFEQLWRGILFGSIAAVNALWLVHTKMLKPTQDFFSKLIKGSQIGWLEVILLSLCAGIGEELFFRGAIQPFLGVWPTAILFIALHGYLNPFDFKVLLYGLLMVIVSAGLGYLMDFMGIFSAITAHAVFDLILLAYLAELIVLPIPEET